MNNRKLSRILVTNTLYLTLIGFVFWTFIWFFHVIFMWIGPFSFLSWWAVIPIGLGFLYGFFVSIRNYFVI